MTAATPNSGVSRPVALITGPTSGLGSAFARKLASQGYDLVLVARDEARLAAIADEVRRTHGGSADVIAADLATEEGRARVAERLSTGVDMLVNNAGFITSDEFWETDLDLLRTQIAVNVTAVMELTHAALPPMQAAGKGSIINVASISGVISGHASTYGASKAWVAKFSEGLAHKLSGSGVRIQALCPGYMKTEFHTRAGSDVADVPDALWSNVDDVVATSLKDLEKNRIVSVPGSRYQLIEMLDRLKPRWMVWQG